MVVVVVVLLLLQLCPIKTLPKKLRELKCLLKNPQANSGCKEIALVNFIIRAKGTPLPTPMLEQNFLHSSVTQTKKSPTQTHNPKKSQNSIPKTSHENPGKRSQQSLFSDLFTHFQCSSAFPPRHNTRTNEADRGNPPSSSSSSSKRQPSSDDRFIPKAGNRQTPTLISCKTPDTYSFHPITKFQVPNFPMAFISFIGFV
jgi:hypothetical protein